MSQIGRRKEHNLRWDLASMLSDFDKDPELCMRGVCAVYVYRRQIAKEKLYYEEGIYNTGVGFNKFDNSKGSMLGDFLTDGNPNGDVVKTVEELRACLILKDRKIVTSWLLATLPNFWRFTRTGKTTSSPNDSNQ